jgi:predicted nucleic acid-binding protein
VTAAELPSVAVVDASALAALLFGEPEAESVAGRLTGRRLVAPTLLRYELVSVFLKKLRRYPAAAGGLTEMLRAFPLMMIDEVQPNPEEMAAMANRTGLTAYDASYLWTADRLGGCIVTLDGRLDAAARELGLSIP